MKLRLTCAALMLLACPGAAGAQLFEEVDTSRPVPGWLMTPSVAIGVTFDDNPALVVQGNPTPSDTITAVAPALDLAFQGRHTSIGLGYNGALVRYRTLDELDSFDQGARAELRHQLSPRAGLQLRNHFSDSPSTDSLQAVGLPFVRAGTRQNQLTAGTTIQATRRLELTGSYRFQWVEFDRPDSPTSPLLDGGTSHAVTLDALQAVSARIRVGGSYLFQRAFVGEFHDEFAIQNGEGVIALQLSPTVSLDMGAGFSHLDLPEGLGSRTGPAAHVALKKRTEHALLALTAMHSFVPGFGFGGSQRSSAISGTVRVPFAGTRGFVQGNLAWHDSESVFEEELGVTSVWFTTAVGYAVQRWLRVEVFYNGAFQDATGFDGQVGQINRSRFGLQLVTLRPMRIH